MQKKCSRILSPLVVCSLTLGLAVGFSLVAVKFYKLQIIENKLWSYRADRQQQMSIDFGAKRGSIYAKMSPSGSIDDYVPLAQDIASFHLYVDAKAVPTAYKKLLAEFLSTKLAKSSQELLIELEKPSRFRKLAWDLDIETKKVIEKDFKKFIKKKKIPRNALFFLSGYKRFYPMGSLAGSLLHLLGTREGSRGPERVPTGGLEKRFDHVLKGTSGLLVASRTPKGRLDGTKIIQKPSSGADIYLTIHPLVQSLVEKQLKQAVSTAKAKGGWAIVMDPQKGDILAIAQVPSLDLEKPEMCLKDPSMQPYLNLKALTDPFEPGSIMKPFTMLVALKANRVLAQKHRPPIFDPDEKVPCLDGRFPGRKNPIKDVHGYPYLNMDMALQKSSNIYMAKTIQKVTSALGDHFYAQELKDTFGFGCKTALNIGVESSGFVPTPGKKTANHRPEWSTPTPFSLAMGYNLLATSLQMTKAFCMIANGGKDVEPVLVKKIVKRNDHGPDEMLFDDDQLPKSSKQLIHPDDVKRVLKGMQFAVNKGGTAFRAKIPGFTSAGKTATTEKLVGGHYSKDKHISTFVGFAPLEMPKFVCLIVIDEPEKFYIEGVGKNQYGGVCAAPSFSVIGAKTLEILGASYDDPLSLTNPKDSKTYKDLKQLEDLFNLWNH